MFEDIELDDIQVLFPSLEIPKKNRSYRAFHRSNWRRRLVGLKWKILIIISIAIFLFVALPVILYYGIVAASSLDNLGYEQIHGRSNENTTANFNAENHLYGRSDGIPASIKQKIHFDGLKKIERNDSVVLELKTSTGVLSESSAVLITSSPIITLSHFLSGRLSDYGHSNPSVDLPSDPENSGTVVPNARAVDMEKRVLFNSGTDPPFVLGNGKALFSTIPNPERLLEQNYAHDHAAAVPPLFGERTELKWKIGPPLKGLFGDEVILTSTLSNPSVLDWEANASISG